MKKIYTIMILACIMSMLFVSEVFASNMDSTRRINSKFTFDRFYSDASLPTTIPMPYSMPTITSRRPIMALGGFEADFGGSEFLIEDAQILDSMNGDGSMLSTKRINSKYEFNRNYGKSRSFLELMLSGNFLF